MSGVPPKGKTFYLETFGCQMNVHDSEKVAGTLLSEGYRQVSTVAEADLILYNTCSIRDKAEQKVFNRLNDYKKLQAKGKKFGVLGCVAQQEGEKIFERAPHVSLVCGSASYTKLPEMLVQLESTQRKGKSNIGKNGMPHFSPVLREVGHPGSRASEAPSAPSESREANAESLAALDSRLATHDLVRITGLDDRQTDHCFETEFTARSNPHRGYITIIEGCDKFCAYCVVPFTRTRTAQPPISPTAITFSSKAATPGRTAKSQVPGNMAAAFQPARSGAPLQMSGFHRGSRPCPSSSPLRTRRGKFWVRLSPAISGCPATAKGRLISIGSTTRTVIAQRSTPRPARREPAGRLMLRMKIS